MIADHNGKGKPLIVTRYMPVSIPDRNHDWMAWYDNKEEGPVGYGATEEEAIKDLQEYD